MNTAPTCAAEEVDLAPINDPWVPQQVTTYPGPALGTPTSNASIALSGACHNPAGDPELGDDIIIPVSTSLAQSWTNGTRADYGLGVYAPTTDTLHWKVMSSGANDYHTPYLSLTYSSAQPLPYVYSQDPPNGAAPGTLTPLLSAQATGYISDPADLKYVYQIYTSDGVQALNSGLVASGGYRVPAGTLQWGKLYSWTVQAYDGLNYSPNPNWYSLNTAVPQPAVTSSLSQNPDAKGFDASIGNYTTEATDVDVATAGPSLSVVRDYNSRDPHAAGVPDGRDHHVVRLRPGRPYDPVHRRA